MTCGPWIVLDRKYFRVSLEKKLIVKVSETTHSTRLFEKTIQQ